MGEARQRQDRGQQRMEVVGMNRASLSGEEIRKLAEAWRNNGKGSLERRLIEGIFIITGTPAPVPLEATRREE